MAEGPDEPATIASFRADTDTDDLCAALLAALAHRGLTTTAPVSIERATEFSVELGGRLVSLLVGSPPDRPDERFLSIGRLTFASGRLIGQRDALGRRQVAELVDGVLRDDLGVVGPRWWTASAWRRRDDG